MDQPATLTGFLLTRQWRDTRSGLELEFWAASDRGPLRIVSSAQEAVCFIRRDETASAGRRARTLLKDLHAAPVDALYFRRRQDLMRFADRCRTGGTALYESDIKPTDRYLMERFINGSFELRGSALIRPGYLEFLNPRLRAADHRPRLSHVALDIETEGLDGRLYSIAVSASSGAERVFMLGNERPLASDPPVAWYPDEASLLRAWLAWMSEHDPDLIIGWNVVSFDLDFLARRCRRLGLTFTIGRAAARAAVLQPQGPNQVRVARVPGRVVLDGIDALRASFRGFESFELESVANDLLGRGKLIAPEQDRVAEINRLFRQDPVRLAAYNLEDCRLVREIFDRADLVHFMLQRARMTGLALDRIGGSVAAFDHLYLPRLHRRGYVAPDLGTTDKHDASPGGYVMDSRPGLYQNVLVLDFKSLYPSIIRSFLIDPLGLAAPGEDPVPGFLGARFARAGGILPGLITELWQRRDQAKRERDQALSQAVKILMNSFYGVLGSPGCRFFDPRLASSITRRGHAIITRSRDFIQDRGHSVIYGDTDSLFVLLGEGHTEERARTIGAALAEDLNTWWRGNLASEFGLESFLEIEFETHYLGFFMPTLRGAEKGSKKRYAGYVRDGDDGYRLVFKGLESVRSDWTPLAREFQRELYRRIFFKEPYAAYVRGVAQDLRAGRLDDKLVYRKRLRRRLEDYTRNVPPHVQAARKLANPGKWIRYVITRNGPEPVGDGPLQPDYDHYLERQLAPVANAILHFLDTRFEALVEKQMEIF